jgi:rhomboid protease GluP
MITYEFDADHLVVNVSRRRRANEIELLFLARAIDFSVDPSAAGKRFFVPLEQAAYARNEIDRFIDENRRWPPRNESSRESLFRFSPIHLAMVAGLLWFDGRVNRNGETLPWLEQGMMSAERVLAGEWHRTVTALTLHLDVPHLVGNMAGLLLFVGGVHQSVGSGIAWLLVVASGAIGNYLTALFYQTGHHAVGASTAVFGAVGVMGALGVRRYRQQKMLGRGFLVPLIGALGLFAMLGTDPATDVIAHLCGLGAGILLGLATIPALGKDWLRSRLLQTAAFGVTAAVIYYSWQV